MMPQTYQLDKKDRALLACVQKDTRTTVQEMAEIAGLSTASVQRRLRGLRESGVILKEVAVINQKKLDLGITAVVSIELERDSIDQIDAFKRKARVDPQVLHFYCIAGDSDFVMVVVAKDISGYEEFTHRFFFSDRNVRKFRTSIVISTEKTTLELPVNL